MELKWAKRWIRRARGGPSEGWSSKTAPDEPGYDVPSLESDPRAHTLWRVDGKLPKMSGACRAVFRLGCHRRVDQPRAPRNLRFSAEEELARKVTGGGGEEIRRRRVPG